MEEEDGAYALLVEHEVRKETANSQAFTPDLDGQLHRPRSVRQGSLQGCRSGMLRSSSCSAAARPLFVLLPTPPINPPGPHSIFDLSLSPPLSPLPSFPPLPVEEEEEKESKGVKGTPVRRRNVSSPLICGFSCLRFQVRQNEQRRCQRPTGSHVALLPCSWCFQGAKEGHLRDVRRAQDPVREMAPSPRWPPLPSTVRQRVICSSSWWYIIWTLEASSFRVSSARTSPMEDSEKNEALPWLLDLIPDARKWKARDAQGPGRSRNAGFGSEDDEKLELKLGLPGVAEEIKAVSRDEGLQQESPALSLGYFPKPSKAATSTTTTGTKRGFFDTVETKTEGHNEQKQQPIAGCGNELALEGKIAAASERKKGYCPPPPPYAPIAPSVRNDGSRSQAQGRGASAPVVGWPPIRSFRRNLANSSSFRQPSEPQNGETSTKEKLTCRKNPLVKINMDGIPIGRKVDLAAYDSYESLSVAVKDLFHGFLEAQKDISSAESAQNGADEKMFSQLLDGSGEYTLVYEDNEGDRMQVRDVPWNVFVATAKRLRVLRSSELSHGLIGVASRRVTNC